MNPTRARKERFAVIVGAGTQNDSYVMALEIHDVELAEAAPVDSHRDDRYRIKGRVLQAGHPVYDAYVGQAAAATRNPIHYRATAFDLTACRCGCGEPARSDFLPGHDQRAIHDRVARFGSVARFIDWFDAAFQRTS